MKVLKERIYNQLDSNQAEEHAGFRKGYSTIDHIYTLGQIIERAREYHIEVHLMFVDFRKAFDSINRKCILETLREQGVQQKIIRILGNINIKTQKRI